METDTKINYMLMLAYNDSYNKTKHFTQDRGNRWLKKSELLQHIAVGGT